MTDDTPRPKHPRRRKLRARDAAREAAKQARRADRHVTKQQLDKIVRDK